MKSNDYYLKILNPINLDDSYLNYLKCCKKGLFDGYDLNTNNLGIIYDCWKNYLEIEHHGKYSMYYRGIFEFLNTVSPDIFEKRISMIPGFICQTPKYEYEPDYFIIFDKNLCILNNDKNFKFSEKIENLIIDASEASGYTESYRYFDKQYNNIGIAFRPNYTKDLTDFVYNENHGILWHICPKDIWENKIKKTGLIPKWGNKHKRIYAPRAYFYIDCNSKLAINYAKDLKKGIKEFSKYRNYNDYVLLKIDVSNYRYNFYNDTEYPISGVAVFTYNTIHPNCIQFVEDLNI